MKQSLIKHDEKFIQELKHDVDLYTRMENDAKKAAKENRRMRLKAQELLKQYTEADSE